MDLLLRRWLFCVVTATAGGGFAYLLCRGTSWQMFGSWLGLAAGMLPVFMSEGRRADALMRWLRGGHSSGAPRHSGYWGELAYRIERALLAGQHELAAERRKLVDFLSAIDASPNGVLLLDADEQITWCNPVAASHFGLDIERDRGQRVTNLVRVPAFVALLQRADDAEVATLSDLRNGRTLLVQVRVYAAHLRMVLSQDVTERIQAEAMRRDFVANVSHEIRTPLTVLGGFVETLVNLPLTEGERGRVLTLMTQQTQRMQALVADLLTLAHLEGSPSPRADQWIDVAALLDQVEVAGRGLSRDRHVLRFPDTEVLAGQGWQLAGSRDELLSALTNLISNAVRYTPEGRSITVSWALLPSGGARFTVADRGPGIAREHLSRLTQRFYRVDSSRSRETGGTGLGLSIVKHIVHRHDADLDIDSEVGQGSTFSITFPAMRLRSVSRVAAA
jgi:two-component system, OmpR family, phosphate regulon sensor histidine kinase PhoR